MNDLFRYLIHSSVSLVLLYGIYALFLRQEKFFLLNRIYLLMTVICSLIIPLLPAHLPDHLISGNVMIYLEPVIITPDKIAGVTGLHLGWTDALLMVYFTGILIFGSRLFLQLIQLGWLVAQSGITRRYGCSVVFSGRRISPFSFFHLVFLPDRPPEEENLRPILLHEKVHIRQGHSFDILLTECLIIVQWFNPFAWLLRREVKAIHEYLADEGVVRSGMTRTTYQQLILNQTIGFQLNTLTNPFNVSLLKKRFIMMTKPSPTRLAMCKALLAIPTATLVLIFILAGTARPVKAQDQSAQKDQQQKEQQMKDQQMKEKTLKEQQYKDQQADSGNAEDKIFEKVEQVPEYPGGNQALYTFLAQNITYPMKAKDKKVTGTVYVNFVIEKDGSVSHVKVLKGIGSGCDEEAVRVVKLLPKWKPGLDQGKKVRVSFTIPIKFQLS